MGISVRRELQSQIRRIVRHLLKLEHSPAKEPRRGWAESIVDARAEIEDLLEAAQPENRARRDIERQTLRGVDLALRDLGRYQEIDAATTAVLRADSYTDEQVLGDWFPEERRLTTNNPAAIRGDILRSGHYLYRPSRDADEKSMIHPFGRKSAICEYRSPTDAISAVSIAWRRR